MAAINLENAAVTSFTDNPNENVSTDGVGVVINTTSPTPNPIAPIDNPAIVDPENAADLLAPFTLSAIGAGFIGSPVIVAPESMPAQDLPVIVAAESVPATALPVIVSSEAIPTSVTPVIVSSESVPSNATPVIVSAESIPASATPAIVGAESIPTNATPVIVTPESVPVSATPVIVGAESIPVNTTPTIVTAESVPATDLPTAITAIALSSSTPPYTLNHARILYDNLLLGSAVTTTAGANGSYTLIPNTADRWTLTDTGSITFTLASAVDMDTVSIGAHNLGFNGFAVSVEYSINLASAFLSFKATQSPSEDTAMMFHNQSTVSVRRLKITVTGTGSVFLGSIYAGIALQMQRPFFAGHTPITLSATTSRYSSMSEGGNFIGEQIRRIGYSTSADWSNLENAWLRLYFKPFMIHARTLPYYFAWNLLEEPLDIGYCKTSEDIKPAYSGVRNLLDVSFKMVGFG